MDKKITLSIDRRVDGELEEVATFIFSDFAEVAARAICERYRWPVIITNIQSNGDFSKRFEMGKSEIDTVIEV